ncbi:MAG: hypothetical protein KUL77_02875 [Thermomonas sp.]|jgi:hypothetical protein|uniref:hypothetical protein n=1 Tax=Thermomonas sp. TaxID=1971895 RepID=UPI001EC18067|nr:hypothetical protein [Thermomonas sp.]MBV2208490.1 hypothetical protein [Thermomonas sp.]
MTLNIVPSTGLAKAARALSAPRRTATANALTSNIGSACACSPAPIKNCAMIAPELPRAPCSKDPNVEARLLPVSPSGTGNTLILLSSSRAAMTRSIPAINARRSVAAVKGGEAGASIGVVSIRPSVPAHSSFYLLRRSTFRPNSLL